MNKAPLLSFREPACNILEKKTSLSGKYMCFIGVHYEVGVTCYVVGVSNKANGSIWMRHYNEKIKDCIAPRAQAFGYWEEFKNKMTQKSENEYEESYLEHLQEYLQ